MQRARERLAAEDLHGARAALEQALARDSGNAQALVLLAAVDAQQKEFRRAHARLGAALESDPSDALAYDTRGNLLRLEGRLDEAIRSYSQALTADPSLAGAMSNRALCLQDLGQFALARADYEQALRIAPGDPAIMANFALLLFDLGEFTEAMAHIDAILRVAPEYRQAHVVKALALLRRRDFANGWPEYEWRDHDGQDERAAIRAYPEWDGSFMHDQPLLVCAEQGLGDQIMFASCLKELMAVARCVIECDPRLERLFARSFPGAYVYAQSYRDALPWVEDGVVPKARTWLGSLPLRFRRSAADFSRSSAYLVADPERTRFWSQALAKLGSGLKVGISWRGGVATTRRAIRSTALVDWLPILQCPGIRFVSLQYGDCGDEIQAASLAAGVPIQHWREAIEDYDETAALVCALDLVISVQTAVVHLAGALGKPVWVLIPRVAEWRYGEDGDTMPWYPSARLFRQTSSDSWHEPIGRIRAALSR